MRQVNKVIEVTVVSSESIVAVAEKIYSIHEDKDMGTVNIGVSLLDEKGNVVERRSYFIAGEDYDMLVVENPPYAPGKPANEFRETDLWHFIDLIRARNDNT